MLSMHCGMFHAHLCVYINKKNRKIAPALFCICFETTVRAINRKRALVCVTDCTPVWMCTLEPSVYEEKKILIRIFVRVIAMTGFLFLFFNQQQQQQK